MANILFGKTVIRQRGCWIIFAYCIIKRNGKKQKEPGDLTQGNQTILKKLYVKNDIYKADTMKGVLTNIYIKSLPKSCLNNKRGN